MSFIEGRIRFQSATGREVFLAILAAGSMMLAILLLVLPARALAAPEGLSIDKKGLPRVEPGERFDYVLTVSNESDAATAADVTVTDELPDGVKFVEAEPDVCSAPDSANVTCTLSPLAAGESRTITLTVVAEPTKVGTVENRARANTVGDASPPAVSNKVVTTIAPKLVITKLASPDPVNTDGILAYTIRVENQSKTATAKGVSVRDELPLEKVDFRSVDSGDFDCEYKAGIIRCTNGVLGPREVGKIEVVVEPVKAGTIQNTADVFVQGVSEPLARDTVTTKVTSGSGGGGSGGGGGGGGNEPQPLPPDKDKGPLAGGTARGDDVLVKGDLACGPNGNNPCIDQILILTENCKLMEQGDNLTITLSDQGEPFRLIDGENVDITIQKDGTIVANGRKTLGPLATAFNGGEKDNPTRRIIAIPVKQGDTPGGSVNDTFPIISTTGIDGKGCRVLETSDTNQNESSTNQPDDGERSQVVTDTISDNPLPNTGGPSLLGLAVVTFGLAVSGASVITVRRRDR